MKENEEISDHSEDSNIVNIFFRNCRKEAKLVPVHSPSPPSQLSILASICFNVPQERIILFYNGFRIDNYELPVTMTERGIVHVIDQRNIEESQIVVTFRPLWSAHLCRIALPVDIKIKRVIEEYLVPRFQVPEDRFFLVYVGKVLNRSNQLHEESVQDGAEITMVLYKKPECVNRMAVERTTSKRIEEGLGSVGLGSPVTYMTSLQSLKKKSQQSESQYSHKNTEPKHAPEPVEKLPSVNQNQTISVGPLEKSAMVFSNHEKKFLEKAGAGASSEERAAPDEKDGSNVSGRSGSGATAGIKIVILGSGSGTGSGEEKFKINDAKILQLQSKTQSKTQARKEEKGGLQKLLQGMESQSEK